MTLNDDKFSRNFYFFKSTVGIITCFNEIEMFFFILDIDECKLNPNICGGGAKCENLDGGYKCSGCPAGTSLNKDKTKCVGVEEIAKPGKCFAAKENGVCKSPLRLEISKKKCCCQNMGKAFGDKCEMCPGLATSKICI